MCLFLTEILFSVMAVNNETLVPPESISVISYECPEQLLSDIACTRRPAVIRGCPLGQCLSWTPDYLVEKLSGTSRPVHVTSDPKMNFIKKNFSYSTMDIGEVIKLATEVDDDTKYYLRAVSDDNPRVTPACLETDFPTISSDFKLPDSMLPSEKIFSSVLRLSSGGVQVWTHYDVMDNIYCQIIGHKRAVLWGPEEVDNMYMAGDKSMVVDIDQPDLEKFPKFIKAKRYEAELGPGDILFIPALWFHNMLAHDFGVAVNVFWKELEDKMYDPKDPYGNKDHVPAAKSFQSVDNIIKNLNQLPAQYRDFYCRRIVARLQSKCQLVDEINK